MLLMIVHLAQIGRYFARFVHTGEKVRGSGRDEPSKSFGIGKNWWTWPGSNRRPPACKAGALPAELHAHSTSHVHSKAFLPIPKSIPSHFEPNCSKTVPNPRLRGLVVLRQRSFRWLGG